MEVQMRYLISMFLILGAVLSWAHTKDGDVQWTGVVIVPNEHQIPFEMGLNDDGTVAWRYEEEAE